MFVLILSLVACTDIFPSAPVDLVDGAVTEDTSIEEAAEILEVEDHCYELELSSGGVGCYTTRPYFSITNDGDVRVDEETAEVSWTFTVTAAPEGSVILNTGRFDLVTDDNSGTGWSTAGYSNPSFVAENGDGKTMVTTNSNPGGRSLAVGEEVGAQGAVAVGTVSAGDTTEVTITFDISELALGAGDWIRLDVSSAQDWSIRSSEESNGATSYFGEMQGTTFTF
jgi:hypothetical protein